MAFPKLLVDQGESLLNKPLGALQAGGIIEAFLKPGSKAARLQEYSQLMRIELDNSHLFKIAIGYAHLLDLTVDQE